MLCVLRSGDQADKVCFLRGWRGRAVCVWGGGDGGVEPCGAADGMSDQVYRLLFRVLETPPSVNRRVGGTFRRVW